METMTKDDCALEKMCLQTTKGLKVNHFTPKHIQISKLPFFVIQFTSVDLLRSYFPSKNMLALRGAQRGGPLRRYKSIPRYTT